MTPFTLPKVMSGSLLPWKEAWIMGNWKWVLSAARVMGPFLVSIRIPPGEGATWSSGVRCMRLSLCLCSTLLHVLATSAEACHALRSSSYFRED